MKIVVGKYYRRRDGGKVVCLSTRALGGRPIVTQKSCSTHALYTHYKDGRCYKDLIDSVSDIISEWSELPTIDWSLERPWVKAIAMDDGGEWWRFDETPDLSSGGWLNALGYHSQKLHPSEYPTNPDGSKWIGDWKESLIVRPEGGAK